MSNKTDYTKLSGPDFVHACGQDAAKWAEAFHQLNPDANIDEGVMIGWFANAIMHSLDLERGTVINGEHAEYLIENGLKPAGDNPADQSTGSK